MAALGANKAFDRVNHVKLLHRLCDVGVPAHLVRMIMNWYSKIFVVVKLCNTYSIPYHVKSGVRQGGVLSPVLFNLYIDYINALVRSDLGCHIGHCCIGCLVYVDDIILLSASLFKLQKCLIFVLNVVIILTVYLMQKCQHYLVAGMDLNRVC